MHRQSTKELSGFSAAAPIAQALCAGRPAARGRRRFLVWWDRRKLEHITNGSALHAGIRTPRPFGIFVAAPPAVVGEIGIDDQARGAVLLSEKGFYSAKVLPVADQHDLVAHIHFQLFELFEILRRTVVGVDHFRFGVSRWRHRIEGHDDSRVVSEGVSFNVFARRSVHVNVGGRGHVHTDRRRIVHPDAVFNRLSIQPSLGKNFAQRNPQLLCPRATRQHAGPESGRAGCRRKFRVRPGEKRLPVRSRPRHSETRIFPERTSGIPGPIEFGGTPNISRLQNKLEPNRRVIEFIARNVSVHDSLGLADITWVDRVKKISPPDMSHPGGKLPTRSAGNAVEGPRKYVPTTPIQGVLTILNYKLPA